MRPVFIFNKACYQKLVIISGCAWFWLNVQQKQIFHRFESHLLLQKSRLNYFDKIQLLMGFMIVEDRDCNLYLG
jgi:hypothetical protein